MKSFQAFELTLNSHSIPSNKIAIKMETGKIGVLDNLV